MTLPDGRIQIRFLPGKSITPYGANDTPAFRPEFSHQLCALGVAEYADPEADGPKREPARHFSLDGAMETAMLREVERMSARQISPSDADVIAVTFGDAKYDRTTGEVRRRY